MELQTIHTPDGFDPRRLLRPLERALAGDGPAVAPHYDPSPDFSADLPNDDIAVVVSTSGSTGTPKKTMLSTDALGASSSATAERLGVEGQWLLALPVHYVAGLQVLVRSLFAGSTPVVDPSLLGAGTGRQSQDRFTPEGFARAAEEMTGPHRLTSLVPTQLSRLLTDPDGLALPALRSFDAILLGGAPASSALLSAARGEGLRLVQTYGSAETAGGCVYDGVPLSGVRVEIEDGRIILGGPTVASGYLGDPELTAASFRGDGSVSWFRTSDTGVLAEDGRLTISGRIDDVIITGGVKVSASAVREALERIPGVNAAFVTGQPDDEWGQRVVAFVATERTTAEILGELDSVVSGALKPKLVLTAPQLALLPNGKEDRMGMARTLALAADCGA